MHSDRQALGIRQVRKPAECGTQAGYQRHVRENTPICEPCRTAHTEAHRDWANLKAVTPAPKAPTSCGRCGISFKRARPAAPHPSWCWDCWDVDQEVIAS